MSMDDHDPLASFHVPQHCRRHKLRFLHQNDAVDLLHNNPFLSDPMSSSSSSAAALNLSLSTHTRSAGAYNSSPVGPFTGYASILARSRFLRPAQELLLDFSRGTGVGVSFQKQAENVLEDSGSWFTDDDHDISRRCSNPNLVSMLHEIYKRYKLYCQQMQSAVTSFESVAGLGNAAPFACFAVRAMFRHFQCLKNALLDHIRITSKVFGGVDIRRDHTSGACSDDRGHCDQKQALGSNFLQHPVWRSQRGFPDKAVAVLRNWLFEHFLHPYPSDSDKQMLAQKTGLSRNQVSNWFTNARVRLWKPMVEEMHALERKTQSSTAADTSKLVNLPTEHYTSLHPQISEKDFQIMCPHRDQDNSPFKRSRIDVLPRAEKSKEPFGMPYNHLPSNQVIDVGGSQTGEHTSHSPTLGSNQENTTGLSWSSTHGQIVPFWLAKQ